MRRSAYIAAAYLLFAIPALGRAQTAAVADPVGDLSVEGHQRDLVVGREVFYRQRRVSDDDEERIELVAFELFGGKLGL